MKVASADDDTIIEQLAHGRLHPFADWQDGGPHPRWAHHNGQAAVESEIAMADFLLYWKDPVDDCQNPEGARALAGAGPAMQLCLARELTGDFR